MNPEGMVALLNYREDGITRMYTCIYPSSISLIVIQFQPISPSGSTASSRPSSKLTCIGGDFIVSLSHSLHRFIFVFRIGYTAGGSVPPSMMYQRCIEKIHASICHKLSCYPSSSAASRLCWLFRLSLIYLRTGSIYHSRLPRIRRGLRRVIVNALILICRSDVR